MSSSTRMLIGLIAGIAAGIAIAALQTPILARLVTIIEPLGTLWVNALRMTLIPLVFSLLVSSIASAADMGTIGRVGSRAMMLFVALLFLAAVFTALAAPPMLGWLAIDPATVESLRSSTNNGAVEAAKNAPTLIQRLVNLIPVNPIKAAAEGDILPLIIFAVLFGAAIRGVVSEKRNTVEAFFQGVAQAMLLVIRWVLLLAPIGIFALALPLAQRLGTTLVAALAYYVVLLSGLATVVLLSLYPLSVLWARVSLRRFVRTVVPAQTIAFSTQSSLAALPAMIEEAEKGLALPPEVTGLVLPLAVSVFRICNPVAQICGALFIARLYDIHLGAAQMATLIVTAVFVSLGSVGLPGGVALLVTLPVTFQAIGLPIESIAILLAVDVIPDAFRTPANVTADMAVAAIVAHQSGLLAPSEPVVPAHEAGRSAETSF